jgi:hypothetical protein
MCNDIFSGTIKQDLRPWEEIVREMLLHVLESVYPNILSVKDLIRYLKNDLIPLRCVYVNSAVLEERNRILRKCSLF